MRDTKAVPQKHARILLALVLFGLIVRLGMIWIDFGLETCGLKILQDDSVYNYVLARNIVKGLGIAFEHGEPVFSYHPPSVLFVIPFIWLFPNSKEIPIQCLLTFYTVISLATTLFIYRIVRTIANDTAALISSGFWVLSYGIVTYSICGADTPFTTFLLAVAVDYYVRNIRLAEAPRVRSYGALGGLCGLCVLSRMDTLLLLPAFGIDTIWSYRRRLFWGGLRKIAVAVTALVLSASIVTAPFFLRNILYYKSFEVHNASSNRTLSIVMGHYARTLGLKKYHYMRTHNILSTPLNPMVTELDNNIYPIWWGLYAFCTLKGIAVLVAKYGDVFVPLALCISIIAWNAMRQKKGERARSLGQFFRESGISKLTIVLLYAVMHFFSYAFYQFSFWHTARYMYPLAFVATLCLGPATIWAIDRILVPLFSWRFRIQRVTAALFGVCILSFSIQFYFSLYKNLCDGGNGFIQAAKWINEHTPKDAVIGFYQCGYFGYYTERPFHDLGGKQTAVAWDAWLNRQGWDYIKKENVDYIADEDVYLDFVFAWSKMYPINDKLELVDSEFGRKPGTRILIFKVKKTL